MYLDTRLDTLPNRYVSVFKNREGQFFYFVYCYIIFSITFSLFKFIVKLKVGV